MTVDEDSTAWVLHEMGRCPVACPHCRQGNDEEETAVDLDDLYTDHGGEG